MVQSIWEELLKIVREEAGSRVVETWLKAVTLHQWDSIGKIVFLKAPNTFVKEWIKSNYIHLLEQHLARLLNVDTVRVTLIDGQSTQVDTIKSLTHFVPAQPAYDVPVVKRKQSLQRVAPQRECFLNQEYTFDTFVVGSHNQLAYAAAQAVAQKLGTVYNPLFIYGGSGLGKTHLLHAIGNQIRLLHPSVQLLYQTADRFVNEFINAIRFDKIHQFKAKYHTIDVLLVDDIQFISNKDQTQEAFFHIFNSLHESRKQIVFSSDCYPANISGLAERLRSRFSWGLVADIQLPSFETKIAILKRKAHMNRQQLPDDVAEFIASGSFSNVRELEGAFIRVVAFAGLTKQEMTIDLARKVLQREKSTPEVRVDFERIVSCVANHYNLTIEELRSEHRNKQLVLVRHIAMFFMKKLTTKSLHEVAYFLGRKDHTTVIHAVKQVEQSIQTDTQFEEHIKKLEKEISG